jgi:hypothetical protein
VFHIAEQELLIAREANLPSALFGRVILGVRACFKQALTAISETAELAISIKFIIMAFFTNSSVYLFYL